MDILIIPPVQVSGGLYLAMDVDGVNLLGERNIQLM